MASWEGLEEEPNPQVGQVLVCNFNHDNPVNIGNVIKIERIENGRIWGDWYFNRECTSLSCENCSNTIQGYKYYRVGPKKPKEKKGFAKFMVDHGL